MNLCISASDLELGKGRSFLAYFLFYYGLKKRNRNLEIEAISSATDHSSFFIAMGS